MFRKKQTTEASVHSYSFRPTDSFVVDLRVVKKSPAKTAAVSVPPQNKLKIKKVSPRRPVFKLSPLFKPRPWRLFFHSLRPYHWPFFFRRRRFNRRLSNFSQRRFAKTANLHWRNFRHLFGQNEKKQERAEYLVAWYRSLFVFLAALVLIILPFKLLAYFKILDVKQLKTTVLDRSFSAFDNLAAASGEASQMDLSAAGSSFARAASDFRSAQQELNQVNDWLLAFASFSSDPKIRLAADGKNFLAAGAAGAAFGQHLSDAGNVLLNAETDKSWGKLIDAFVEHGGLALNSARELQVQLNGIEADNLPAEYRHRFLSFKQQTDLAVNALTSLLSSAQEIKNFLGVSQDKRYLLVFQNNAEMRGAGGFFGSYALVDIRDGHIQKLEVPAGGSYDTEAGMKSFIQAPAPLQLISARWYFWDANWWPDWPTSARSLMWFYEKSGGPTVDGVISFTPDVLADLLRITGPIDMQADYGLTVDADNFQDLLQLTVEKDNLVKTHPEAVAALPDSPKNQPKKIIGDLMARIMERLPQTLTPANLPNLLTALEKNLSAKNILLYFSDPALQSKISSYGLDGAMLTSKQDYLLIAHTNIAGQKSDRRMEDKIKHNVQVFADGSVIDTLTIFRTHTGAKNEILSGVRNVDWLRVYVPAGSRLLAASGFQAPAASYFKTPEASWEVFPFLANTENKATIDAKSGTKIYSENNKTVFANWVMTDPGETSVINLRYRLPFKVQAETIAPTNWWQQILTIFGQNGTERLPLSLLVQKQPGARAATLDFTLNLPAAWRSVWSYPQAEGWNGEVSLDQDNMRAVLLEK